MHFIETKMKKKLVLIDLEDYRIDQSEHEIDQASSVSTFRVGLTFSLPSCVFVLVVSMSYFLR